MYVIVMYMCILYSESEYKYVYVVCQEKKALKPKQIQFFRNANAHFF